MNTTYIVKRFEDLTVAELHDLLRLRTDVFVVEQQCAYAEVDGSDPGAIHLLGYHEHSLIAYARILPPGQDGLPHIGRVVVRKEERGKGIAAVLMHRALAEVESAFGASRCALAAQSHLEAFYGRFGFARVGEEYLWDGIPHVDMSRA